MNKPESLKDQVTYNNAYSIRNADAMRAFKKRFSVIINILSYLRGDQGVENAVLFELITHFKEGKVKIMKAEVNDFS